jgi:hypothetical protein
MKTVAYEGAIVGNAWFGAPAICLYEDGKQNGRQFVHTYLILLSCGGLLEIAS